MSVLKMNRRWVVFAVFLLFCVIFVYAIKTQNAYALGVNCGSTCGSSPTRQCNSALGLICRNGKCVKPGCPSNDPCCNATPTPATSRSSVTNAPAATVAVPQFQCPMCDTNGDGIIDLADINELKRREVMNPGDTALAGLAAFCDRQCQTNPRTTGAPISTSPSPASSGKGDCSGFQGAGIKDGKTDLIDIEQFRVELNDQVQTLYCDLDASGDVDIIDFTDYIRKGFVGEH